MEHLQNSQICIYFQYIVKLRCNCSYRPVSAVTETIMGIKSLSEIEEQEKQQRKKILDIAYQLVVDNQNLQVRKLASAANVYVPLIYKLFGGKSGLMYEVAMKISDNITEKLQYNLKNYTHPFLQLTQYGINYINFCKDYPQLLRFLTGEEATLSNYDLHAQTHVLQYKITVENSIKILKDIITHTYDFLHQDNAMNEEDKSHYVNKNVVKLWGIVHGLSMLVVNITLLTKYEVISDLKDHIINTFIETKHIIDENIDEMMSPEIYEQSRQIIATLHL